MKNSLPASESLVDYELERAVGSGACGMVYLARDRRNGRACALKEFPTTRGATRQLFREISALFSVEHPNIVRCLDFIHQTRSRRHYLVFEYADGGSLRDLLTQRGPLPLAEALEIMHQVVQGVEHAHARQLVHCDLKPENILIQHTNDRTLYKIADLGIARHLSNLEEHRTSAGSPAYMAPEQFYDEAHCASDLYALGIIFYEMLAGHTPFEYSKDRLWTAHLKEMPDLSPITNSGCQTLIDQLLRKRPQDRPRDAATLLAALEHLGGTAAAIPPTACKNTSARHPATPCKVTAIRRREIPCGQALHVIDGSLFISDGQGTDLYDASRDSLLPRFLRGSVTASMGHWFATQAALHVFDTATRTVKKIFAPRTQIDAVAYDPLRRNVYYADNSHIFCSSEEGTPMWSATCRNYFVQPHLRVLRNGTLIATSGPLNPCITAWKPGGEPAWRVELDAPVLSLFLPASSGDEDFGVITMGLGNTEPSRLLRYSDGGETHRVDLPTDVTKAFDHGAFLTVHRATADGTVVAAVEPRTGAIHNLCTLPGRTLGEAWLADRQLALLERNGRTTRLHLFETGDTDDTLQPDDLEAS